jgi:tetratricopeptide (TPR) repeat protein
MIEHPSPETLALFAEDDPSVDRVEIAAHIEECQSCALYVEAAREMLSELERGEVLQFLRDLPAARERVKASHHYLDFKRAAERCRAEVAAAEQFFPTLVKHPVREWPIILGNSPEHHTIPMADRILEEAELLLDEQPAEALRLIDLADELLNDVDAAHPIMLTTARGDAWRQRSNAYRHLFQLQDALNAAILAEHTYRQMESPEFSVALAQNTRAVALFKMMRLNEALDLNIAASNTLRTFGPSLPFAKSLMFEAGIRLEQGFIAKAQGLWRQALLILESLSDSKQKSARETARCLANLAECSYRLGDYVDAAEASATAAACRWKRRRSVARGPWRCASSTAAIHQRSTRSTSRRNSSKPCRCSAMRDSSGWILPRSSCAVRSGSARNRWHVSSSSCSRVRA